MTTAEARQLVQKTFQNPFDKGQFIYFIKNLVNEIDESKAFHARGYVHEKYRGKVKTYERLGTYTDPESNKIDILVVYLQKESSIDRARTTLRNFVGDYLKERGEKEAGLIAFVSPNEKDWRFSLVKMEYKITETPSGRVKAKEEFTPAKRYSFLVGVEETSHTAQSRLVPILEDDAQNPTLKQIEEAFNIEKVTKEFFEKYRELYLWVKETLDEVLKNDNAIQKDFTAKNIDTVDFGKKLLGQIVFLYFLQKKGWFGVKRGEEWGSGSKNFLRELFDRKHGDYKNFFNEILEPLFYEALRNDRSHDDHYFSMFKCKIPFLNGGLFDPINNYDWKETDIILPNDLFSNQLLTKEKDKGTGILDIFDRYNFTVKEDEPLEKEVAVDPEMLGKVFENLLEVKDRKSKGTYYTPREIVHYMCQESLVNYLATELDGKASKKDIETLIKYGESVVEHEAEVESRGKETKTYSYKLPKSIKDNAKLIDEKLETIRICDPAVGSGAFPVGMMNEIIRARNALTSYLKTKKGRTIYDFKRHAIQNCLYGVDIDLGAVEIAKLRLWLSLIVDEEDIKQIKPLPNLDYKVIQGNSLLAVEKNSLFVSHWIQELEKAKEQFFNETNPTKKHEHKKKIDELLNQITNGNKEFDFEIYFSEVFKEKNGFDVVIANPPYVFTRGAGFTTSFKKVVEKLYFCGRGKINLFSLFIERASKILKQGGIYIYIIPNTFFRATSYKLAREYIVKRNKILQIVDLHSGIFENVTASTTVLEVKNISNPNKSVEIVDNLEQVLADRRFLRTIDQGNFENGEFVFSIYLNQRSNKLIEKLKQGSFELKDVCKDIIEGIVTPKGKSSFIFDKQENNSYKPFLEGKDIDKYQTKWRGKYIKFDRIKLHRARPEYLWASPEKILIRRIGGGENAVIATLDQNKFYTYASINNLLLNEGSGYNYKYILALLNSKLLNWFYIENFTNRSGLTVNISRTYLDVLPIKKTASANQKPFIDLVDKILAITKGSDYLENSAKQAKVRDYEKQIDQLVYKLYGLTLDEIKIVEENEK